MAWAWRHVLIIGLALIALCACRAAPTEPAATSVAGAAGAFRLTSAAFAEGEAIPERYTCAGENVSPPLAWDGAPEGTAAFALIMDDPDAPIGAFTHWVLYDLPVAVTGLPESIAPQEALPSGGQQGRAGMNRPGYTGPCPPSGTHRYFFKLYALDTTLNLSPGATRQQVERAMEGHILAEAQLMGRYTKK